MMIYIRAHLLLKSALYFVVHSDNNKIEVSFNDSPGLVGNVALITTLSFPASNIDFYK